MADADGMGTTAEHAHDIQAEATKVMIHATEIEIDGTVCNWRVVTHR